ncbi:MAG: hypothetical protein JRG91_19195, partial [Deltaproteobacteria bacterium]|nr:hypothetical protein [Deltaproteobacteria bacterium]
GSMLLPGHYLYVLFGGAFGPKPATRHLLITGPMTSDGTATVNTLYDVQDDNHSDLLAGVGGPTAAACRAARANFRTVPIKLVITEDNGAGVAATGDIVPAGTATSDGTLTAKICGRTYTSTIVTGDTPIEISEKLNLLLNPTRLEMAMRLANEFKVDFNAHIASLVFHTAADGANAMVAANATNLGTLITLINEARTNYEAHRVLVGGGPCHGQADAVNVIAAAVSTDLDTVVVLLKDLKAKMTAHQANIAGAPQVHLAIDTANPLDAEDPVDETHPHLPVTSYVDIAGPHVTVDAKFLGTMGNEIRVRASTDAGGVTFTEPTDNRLASGANEPDYSSAYAVALLSKHTYIVPVTNIGTVLAAATVGLKDRLIAAEQPDVGLRMQAIIGHNRSSTEAETLGDTLDNYVFSIKNIESDTPPWEMAGGWAGKRLVETGVDLSVNLMDTKIIGVVPPEDPGDYPTPTEIDNALHHGVSILKVTDAGDVVTVYNITTRHTDGAGHADLSVWGCHKVDVGFALAEEIVREAAIKYSGYKIGANPTDPEAAPIRNTCTPAQFETFVYKRCYNYESAGHLKNGSVSENRASIHAEINGVNPNRFDYEYPFDVVDHLNQTCGLGQQVG